jgi:intraflagellar transport protein 122
VLTNCAALFKKNKEHGYAKEIFLKLGDMKSLMNLHIEMEKWEEAFLLGKQNRELLELAKIPYANYLLKNDKYE